MRKIFILGFLVALVSPVFAQYGYERCHTMEVDSVIRFANFLAPLSTEPDPIEFEEYKAAAKAEGGSVIYTIPVIVHVIHNGDPVGTDENIPATQVYSQIDVLNEDFRKMLGTPGYNTHPDGADTEIEFCPAAVDPSGNVLAEPGINRVDFGVASFSSTATIDGTLKPATYWNPDNYLNIWVINYSGSLLGYAQFPESTLGGMSTAPQDPQTDGVVVRYDAFGRVGNVMTGAYDEGRTLTHEVGHYLGLRHIWGDGGCSVDDFCSDTPLSDASNYGCPSTNSCTDPGGDPDDMVENYMDYTDDDCMNIFTEDQKYRMRFVLDNSPRRMLLTSSTVCTVPSSFAYTGRVEDTGGNGIAGANVLIDGSIADYNLTTDANGYFNIASMFSDTYDFYAGQWGYVTNAVLGSAVDSSSASITIVLEEGYYDDFIFDFGWIESSDASTGIWEKDIPIGTSFTTTDDSNMGDDVGSDYGLECYMTGNGGGGAGDDDVDGGATILESPVFDLSGYTEPYLKYYRWFFNDGGTGTPDDTLTIRLHNGITRVDVEVTDVSDPNQSQWVYQMFKISDYITPTANMTFTVRAVDQGAGHLSEAGLDLWQVTDSTAGTVAAPAASFSGSPTTICVGQSVSFTDMSTNSPTSWSWSFPGGTPNTSTAANPSITYNSPGTYNVTLTATNAGGSDSDTRTAYITVNGVEADFSASTTTACTGESISFTDNSDCGPTTWSWSFPGGTPNTSTAANPTVTYNTAGTYNVTLTASNSLDSDTRTISSYITISDGAVYTVATDDVRCNGDDDGTATISVTSGTSPYTYNWSIGSTAPVVSGLPPGSYTVTVTDANGCAKTESFTIAEPTALSVLTSGSDDTGGNTGSTSASASGGTAPYSYQWNDPANQATATASGLGAGSYTVTVTDANGCENIQTVTIGGPNSIFELDGGLSISLSPNPTTGQFSLYFEGAVQEVVQVEVFNAIGQLVFEKSQQVGQYSTMQLDISDQAKGVYLIKVSANNKAASLRLVKTE